MVALSLREWVVTSSDCRHVSKIKEKECLVSRLSPIKQSGAACQCRVSVSQPRVSAGNDVRAGVNCYRQDRKWALAISVSWKPL